MFSLARSLARSLAGSFAGSSEPTIHAGVRQFEGIPTHPDNSRYWQVCEKYKVNQFYTAPTAIRALKRLGDQWVTRCDLSSLRIIGSVGEPINPDAWNWYRRVVGKERCAVVDTWWQVRTALSCSLSLSLSHYDLFLQ